MAKISFSSFVTLELEGLAELTALWNNFFQMQQVIHSLHKQYVYLRLNVSVTNNLVDYGFILGYSIMQKQYIFQCHVQIHHDCMKVFEVYSHCPRPKCHTPAAPAARRQSQLDRVHSHTSEQWTPRHLGCSHQHHIQAVRAPSHAVHDSRPASKPSVLPNHRQTKRQVLI